jgi:hypothetical protein
VPEALRVSRDPSAHRSHRSHPLSRGGLTKHRSITSDPRPVFCLLHRLGAKMLAVRGTGTRNGGSFGHQVLPKGLYVRSLTTLSSGRILTTST